MKKVLFFLTIMTIAFSSFSQDCSTLSVSATVTDENCSGGIDGTISIETIGGYPPYSYQWSFGNTSSVVSGLGAGTYMVTVYDSNTCVATLSAVVGTNSFAPVISNCPTDTVVQFNPGECSATVSWLEPIAYEYCSLASLTLTSDYASGSVFPIGSTLVTYTTTDAFGESSTCSFNVTVVENEIPTFTFKDTTIYLDSTGVDSISLAEILISTNQNCGIVSLSLSDSVFDCSDVFSDVPCQEYAIDFAGLNDKVTIPGLNINPGNLPQLTFSAWVKRTGNNASYHQIVSNNSGGIDRGLYVLNGDYVIFAGRYISTFIPSLSNEWEFISVYWSSSSVKLYRNGILEFSTSGESFVSGSPFTTIGNSTYGNSHFNGIIDEARFWSYERTAAEITASMNSCLDANEPGLYAYYNFDEATGTSTITDNSVNNFHGQLNMMSMNGGRTTDTPELLTNVHVLVPVTGTDSYGNIFTSAAKITVLDTLAPTPLCNDIVVQLDEFGDAVITVADVNNGSFDECGIASISISDSIIDCSYLIPETVNIYGRVTVGYDDTTTIYDLHDASLLNWDLDLYALCTELPSWSTYGLEGWTWNDTLPDTTTITSVEIELSFSYIDSTGTKTYSLNGISNGTSAGPVDISNPCAASNISFVLDHAGYNAGTANTFTWDLDPYTYQVIKNEYPNTVTDTLIMLTVTDASGNVASCNAKMKVLPYLTDPGYYFDIYSCEVTICPPGTYCPGGTTEALLCEAGYYQDMEGQTECIPCEAGSYSYEKGSISCDLCPLGRYSSTEGSTFCEDCPPGTFGDAPGATECTNCISGTYNPYTGNYTCIDCPAGTISTVDSASVCEACVPEITCEDDIIINNDAGQCNAYVSINTPAVIQNCSFDIFGNALHFNGMNTSVNNPYGAVYDNQNFLTVEAWCRPTNYPMMDQFIWAKGQATNVEHGLGFINGSYACRIQTGNGSITVQGNPVIDGEWTHMAMVYDGFQLHLYVNGILQNASPITGTIAATNSLETVGSGGNSAYFEGEIDELRIWSSARTAIEVNDNMNGELVGYYPDLITYYKFNQGVAFGDNSSPAIDYILDDAYYTSATLMNFGLVGLTSNWVAGVATNSTPTITNSYNGTADASGIYPVGTTMITWTATDIFGNDSSCVQQVTVNDSEAPNVFTQNPIVYLDENGQASITAEMIDNGSTDNCGIDTITISTSDFTCADIGNITIDLTVTDFSTSGVNTLGGLIGHWAFESNQPTTDLTGNWGTLQTFGGATIANGYLDVDGGAQFARVQGYTGAPISNKTLISWLSLNNLGVTSGSALTIDRISIDLFDAIVYAEQQAGRWMAGSNGFSRTQIPNPGYQETIPNTDVMVAITYEDLGSNNVKITLYHNGVEIATYNDNPLGTWSAGDAEIWFGKRHGSNTSGPGALDAKIYEAQLYDRALSASEIAALYGLPNSATASATVTVLDDLAPVLSGCPADITVSCNNVPVAANVTATDNCDNAVMVTLSENRIDGISNNDYILIREWTSTDASGNTASCTQTITVEDNEQPTIICPSAITINTDPGLNTSSSPIGFATAMDNCSETQGIVITSTPASPFALSLFGGSQTHAVTWTAMDESGNSSTCMQAVTVVDTEAPTFNCPPDQTLSTSFGQCTALSFASIIFANDNSGAFISVTGNGTSGGYPLGVTEIVWSATDPSGNTTSCTQTITVIDNTPPNTFQILFAIYADCNATIVDIPTTTDNCAGTITATTTDPLYYDVPGNYTITWIYDDGNGNTSTQNQSVIIQDQTPPVINCLADINVDASNSTGASVMFNEPVGTDNCSGAITSLIAGLPSGSNFPIGTTTVTYEVVDLAGLSAQCSFNVNVTGIAPSIVCPANITVDNEAGLCEAAVSFDAFETTAIPASTITYSHTPGSSFPVGTTTVTATATNAVGTSSCSFDITVQDNEAPIADLASLPVISGDCDATVLSAPSATDNCAGTVTGTTTAPLTYSAQGTYTVIWIYDDGNGNSSTQTQTVIVNDLTPPVAICQDATVVLDAAGTGSVTAAAIDNGSSDACGPVSLSLSADIGSNVTYMNYSENWQPFASDFSNSKYQVLYTASELAAAGLSAGSSINSIAFNIAEKNTNTPIPNFEVSVAQVALSSIGNANNDFVVTPMTTVRAAAPYTTTLGWNDIKFSSPIIWDGTSGLLIQTCHSGGTNGASATDGVYTYYTSDNQVVSGYFQTCTALQGLFTHNVVPQLRIWTDTKSFDCSKLGVNTTVLAVTDNQGNTTNCSTTITVQDHEAPIADLATLPVISGDCDATVLGAPSATDNCLGAITGTTTDPLIYTTQGTYTITWTYDDGNGNASTQTQTVIVDDLAPPVAICQDATAVLDAAGTGSVTAAAIDNGSSDACGPVSLSLSADIGSNVTYMNYSEKWQPFASDFSNSKYQVLYTASELAAAGLSAGNSINSIAFNIAEKNTNTPIPNFEVSVAQVALSSIGNANNDFVVTPMTTVRAAAPYTTTLGWNDIKFSSPIIWDGISGLLIQTCHSGGTNGASDTDGVYTYNTSNNQVVTGYFQTCTALQGLYTHNVVPQLRIWTDAKNFDCSKLGINPIALKVTDLSGNSSSCSAVVTVFDNEAPIADLATLPVISGDCDATVLNFPTATDNCAGAVTGTTTDPLTYAAQGTYIITWTFDDGNGNASTQTQTVIVADLTPPTINCLADINVNASSSMGASVMFNEPVGTDNCSGAVTSLITGLPSGSTFPIGTTTVTYEVVDIAGLSAQCSFDVIVTGIAPSIVCPANITVDNEAGLCEAAVSFEAFETTAIPASTISYSHAPGSSFPVGTTTVTATATNAVGTSSCSFNVIVIDNEAPVLSGCPTNISVSCNNVPLAANVTVTDNCDNTVTVTLSESRIDGISNNDYILIREWTSTDASGNTASCTQTITVEDNEQPTIICPSAITINTDPGLNTSSSAIGFATAMDNCTETQAIVITSTPASPFALSLFGGSQTHTVTWTAMDESGNSSTCMQAVTVVDTEAPTFNCPPDQTLSTSFGQCTALSFASIIFANDNSGAFISVTGNGPSGGYPLGVTEIVWSATDPSGNTTSCTQTITVIDNTPPQSFLFLPTLSGECEVSVLDFPTATDNCAGVVTATTSDPLYYNTQGSHIITWTFDDGNGNASTQTQTVIVADLTPPTINCLTDINLNASSSMGASVMFNEPVGTDNCSGAVTSLITGLPSGSTFPIGTTTITYEVVDIAGLSAQCSFNIIVTGIAPSIVCPANITVDNEAGLCEAAVSFNAFETTAIPASTISYSHAPSSNFPVGTTTVTATATNAVGTSSCTFDVTVTDNELPSITCSADQTQTADAGLCEASVLVIAPATADNCGVASISNDFNGTADASGIYPVGTTTVIWTVTDIHGNMDICTQTITVTDNELPSITCAADQTQTADAGLCEANVQVIAPVTADNCAVTNISNDFNGTADASGIYPVGTTTVIWTVTDIHGNSNFCTQTITVTDDENPLIVCEADQARCATIIANNEYQTIGTEFDLVSMWDNCEIASVSNNQNGLATLAGHVFASGTTVITWTVTDIHGNVSRCSMQLTVNPLPVASIASSSADDFCSVLTLTASSSTSENLYLWSTGETTQTIDLNQTSTSFGTISVSITDLNGCSSSQDAQFDYDPENEISSYTILAFDKLELKEKNYVETGSVGLTGIGKTIKIKNYSTVIGPGAFVKGDNLNIYANATVNTPIYDPAVVELPAMHYNTEPLIASTVTVQQYANTTINANNVNLKIKKNATVTISGDAYGKIEIDKGCTVTFTSAEIDIKELKTKNGTANDPITVKFIQDTKVKVFNKVRFDKYNLVNPDNYNVVFYVGENPEIELDTTSSLVSNFIYGFRGDDEKDFWRYNPANNTWMSVKNAPEEVKYGGALVYAGGDYVYAFRGDDKKDFWRYNVLTNIWTEMQDAPQKVKNGGALVYDGGNFIYALRGDDEKSFWKYSISADSWTSLSNTPQDVKDGGSLSYTGDNYLYAFRGDDKDDFWRYNIASNAWSSMDDAPEKVKSGGALVYAGGDYLYGLRGDDEHDFWSYHITSNTWTSMANTPNDVKYGGALVHTGGDDIFAFRGDDSNNFWRYSIAQNSWFSMQDVPDDVKEGGALTYAPGLAVPLNNNNSGDDDDDDDESNGTYGYSNGQGNGSSNGNSSLTKGDFHVHPKATTVNASAYVPNGKIEVHSNASSSQPGHMNGMYIANEVKAGAKYTYWNWNSCGAILLPSASFMQASADDEKLSAEDIFKSYPNPFMNEAIVEFTVTEPGKVVIDVYNVLGEKVAQVFDAYADEHTVYKINVDGSELSSGMYFVHIKTDRNEQTIKMMKAQN